MGLPIWSAPSPEDACDAIKVDLSASSRSSIRRRGQRSPVVPRRARRSANAHAAPAPAPYARSPRRGEFGFRIGPNFDFDSLGQSHTARRDRDRDLTPLPPVPESRNYTHDARERAEATRVRPASEYYRYGYRSHDSSPHYFGLSEERDSLQSPHLPPPRPRHAYDHGGLPLYTPNFAPAAYNPSHGFTPLPPVRRSRSRPERIDIDSDEEATDPNPVGLPPLRRMGRRTIADGPLPSSSLRESWSPVSTVDGLGDRERSVSPVDDHWDTMLTTVAPDPHLPSVDSSFTSAAASASFSASHPSTRSASSNSNSASSSRTHLTIPSTTSAEHLLTGVCESSDDDSAASDTEVSESSSIAPAHISSGAAPTRNPTRYSRALRDRSAESRRFVRNFYSFTPPRTTRPPPRPGHAYRSQPPPRPTTASPEPGLPPTHPRTLPPPGGYSYSSQPRPRRARASPSPGPPPLISHVPDGPILDEPIAPEAEEFRAILRELVNRDDVSPEFWVSAGFRLERLEREHQRVLRLEREHQRP